MYFAIICKDKPGQPELRPATRPAHVEYLASFGKSILVAGPLLGDDDQPNGSLIILEADDQAAAEAFSAGDPYAKAGVFESVTVVPWRKSIPKD